MDNSHYLLGPALRTVSVSVTLTVPHLLSVAKEPKVRRAFTLTQAASDRLDWLMANQHVWNAEYRMGIPFEQASSYVSSCIYHQFVEAINAPGISEEKRNHLLKVIG